MSSYQHIYESLKIKLINGYFVEGERLKSDVLKHDYDVSRSTIREILFRLSTIGLVDFFEQRGFRMPLRCAKLQHDLAQNRIMLESEGALLSLRYGGVAWEARLTAAHHELKYIESKVSSPHPPKDLLMLWTKAELNFHKTLISECRSEVLKELHLIVFQRFRQQLIARDKDFAFVPENIPQHQNILDAALSHDEKALREKIYIHLSRHLIDA